MSNPQHDHMDEKDIKPPKRMPNTEWDKILTDQERKRRGPK